MSEKKIFISGKEIDYGNMSDERLLNLYEQLLKRQAVLQRKAQQYIEKNRINEIDINDVNV